MIVPDPKTVAPKPGAPLTDDPLTVHLIDLDDPLFEEAWEKIHESDLVRVQAARAYRTSELASARLRADILHAQEEIHSWQHTPLDEISPPRLAERALPIVAGIFLAFGPFAMRPRSATPTGVRWVGPALLLLYTWLRHRRRQRAQVRVQTIVARWQTDLARLEQLLEQYTTH